ncbi:MAG: Fe-S cluster assembly protein SufB [Thermoplasmata archaeon]|jgi:Fe-S cluster assembly protein SufB|nr:Fe-S cluster assembly protein SufB [Thermoplasmatales archaeon]
MDKGSKIDEIIEERANGDRIITRARYPHVFREGLDRSVVEEISEIKGEPEWMRRFRLKALEIFNSKPMPNWGPPLDIDFNRIRYYVLPDEVKARRWEDLPEEIRETYEKLGIPEIERKYLSGSVAQLDSEGVYANIKRQLEEKGVIFLDSDSALKRYPDLFKEYFFRIVPVMDSKFSALNGAVWSGGSFIYVPENVRVDLPLMTYFRMNMMQEGQFEHTIIIAEKGSYVSYIEGCTAPIYNVTSLHSAVVEVYVKENAHVKFTTVQNWSRDILNLSTERARVERMGRMEWVSGSLGSRVTMLYPSSYLVGEGATASHLSISLASDHTWKDNGSKVIHFAPNTSSKIISKSISLKGGTTVFRGLVRIPKGSFNSVSHVQCDALILDESSRNFTFPHNEVYEESATVTHEASAGRIGEEQLFYIMSRGLTEDEARSMIVLGFLDDVMKEIPLEFSLELNRLIKLKISELGGTG